jgi:hypothetical protein
MISIFVYLFLGSKENSLTQKLKDGSSSQSEINSLYRIRGALALNQISGIAWFIVWLLLGGGDFMNDKTPDWP